MTFRLELPAVRARALWGQQAMAGMRYGGMATGSRLEAEPGYGLLVGSRLVGTPRFAVGTSSHGRDYRLGYGMRVAERGALRFELGVDAHRRQSPAELGATQGVGGRQDTNDGARERPPKNTPDPVSCRGLPDLVTASEVPAMQILSPDIFFWVLGGGAFLLALWASCRIGLWLMANVARDVREQIEGE